MDASAQDIEEMVNLLIQNILGPDTQIAPSSLKSLERKAITHLRDPRHPQVNHFEIWRRLVGLDEKFRVLSHDSLADALSSRVDVLREQPEIKWVPDALALFLTLSDDPLNQTRLEDLDLLKGPSEKTPVTSADILRDDPLDREGGLWDDVDFAAEGSSEDEWSLISDGSSEDGAERRRSSSSVEETLDVGKYFERQEVDVHGLQDIQAVRYWNRKATGDAHSGLDGTVGRDAVMLTETRMVREVLFMLHGLPTAIFTSAPDLVFKTEDFAIRDVPSITLQDLLEQFAQLGKDLNLLRIASRQPERLAVLQTFQSELGHRIQKFDQGLSGIEDRFIHPSGKETLTLAKVLAEVQHLSGCLVALATILPSRNDSSQTEFILLEHLFDLIVSSQAIDDIILSKFVSTLFFQCLKTYLKPISSWMTVGELNGDPDSFFTSKHVETLPLSRLWTDQYKMRSNAKGEIPAPKFLHIAAKKIFNTGKSIIFLKQLGLRLRPETFADVPDLASLMERDAGWFLELCPFEDLFAGALDNWIASQYQSASERLLHKLGSSCGLWRSLDALDHIYLHQNGYVASSVASQIFQRIDRKTARDAWNDRFVLTEILQETYSTVSCIDPARISIIPLMPPEHGTAPNNSRNRSVKDLANLRIQYTLPWSVSNILRPKSLEVYQWTSTLLLQILRAKQLLLKHKTPYLHSHSTPRSISARILSLRHRFLWFLNILHAYITRTVCLQASQTMRRNLQHAIDVDDMIYIHDQYIKILAHDTFTSEARKEAKKALISTMDLVVLFEPLLAAYARPSERDVGETATNIARLRRRTQRRRSRADDEDHTSSSDESVDEKGSDRKTDAEESRGLKERSTASDVSRLIKISDTFERLLGFIVAEFSQRPAPGKEDEEEPVVVQGFYSQVLLDEITLGMNKGGISQRV
ncbi:hypothetical protein MMC25_004409 [Agyrium rufum]|nr:hypothetical protein [Agyrium rufum]